MVKGADGPLDPHSSHLHSPHPGLPSIARTESGDSFSNIEIHLDVREDFEDKEQLYSKLNGKFLTLIELLDKAKISVPQDLSEHFNLPIIPIEQLDTTDDFSIAKAFRFKYQMRLLENNILPVIDQLLEQGKSDYLQLPKITSEIVSMLNKFSDKVLTFRPPDAAINEFKRRADEAFANDVRKFNENLVHESLTKIFMAQAECFAKVALKRDKEMASQLYSGANRDFLRNSVQFPSKNIDTHILKLPVHKQQVLIGIRNESVDYIFGRGFRKWREFLLVMADQGHMDIAHLGSVKNKKDILSVIKNLRGIQTKGYLGEILDPIRETYLAKMAVNLCTISDNLKLFAKHGVLTLDYPTAANILTSIKPKTL